MKKIPVTLLILLCSVFFTNGAIAQNKPLACQTDAVGGLQWENGQWVVSKYVPRKFILVQTKDGLSKESVAKAFSIGDAPELVSCINNANITCYDLLGDHLLFDLKTLRGGISSLYGSISTSTTTKDSVTVQMFSCTAF